MLRLSRKNRTDEDLGILSSGGIFDLFDNSVKFAFRINDEELDYLCKSLPEEELDLMVKDDYTFSEKRKLLETLSKNLKEFYEIKNNTIGSVAKSVDATDLKSVPGKLG